ncbi:MAG: hypothetical protein OXH57_00835 [Ekhidna sp.]|nr:hypothetical protein [Ekhidna sp.]
MLTSGFREAKGKPTALFVARKFHDLLKSAVRIIDVDLRNVSKRIPATTLNTEIITIPTMSGGTHSCTVAWWITPQTTALTLEWPTTSMPRSVPSELPSATPFHININCTNFQYYSQTKKR